MKKALYTLAIYLIFPITIIFSSNTVVGSYNDSIIIEKTNKTEIETIKHMSEKKTYTNTQPRFEPNFLSEEQLISDDDISLIAWITIGEAEGESEEGKRLVIDTILNRVDNESFPDSIYDVIYQKNQFSCVWNGRLTRIEVTDEVCDLVREELENRCNKDVLYFTAGDYGKYGEELFQVGNHYFCGE